MPGMGTGFDDYYWPIVAFIRAEEEKQKLAVSAPSGDIAKGYELFKKHQCAGCHWTGTEGGRRGTNLSQLTATAQYVRESMKNPDTQIDGTYQSVILLDKNGRVLTGRRMNENTFSILLMDDQENLYAIAKANLEKITMPHKSIMPSFKDQLSDQDIEDITTYLFSIRKGQSK